jgi:hypothetical protein
MERKLMAEIEVQKEKGPDVEPPLRMITAEDSY